MKKLQYRPALSPARVEILQGSTWYVFCLMPDDSPNSVTNAEFIANACKSAEGKIEPATIQSGEFMQ